MNPIEIMQSQNVGDTERIGAMLAHAFLNDSSIPPFIALYGDLGVGKTAFVRGFASVISPTAPVRSPTFALVNEYRSKVRPLFHFDMYRIDSEDDLISIGFYDYLDRHGICLVEWSEKIGYALPESYVRVTIEKISPEIPDQRRITIEQIGENT